ncbi:DDE superfamily endonuclease [Popillia japonica]|uniref:DDE superfamily endonuclease n=1 Tax=Popillia japonica TaxID=7064 RepID=A0AAW1IFF8_POPJA
MDWLHLFLKRNLKIAIRKSVGVSWARSRGLNKENVLGYFSLLQNILAELHLLDKPGNMFKGMFLPPACVLKGKNEKAEYKDGIPPGSIIFMSQKSAYVTTEIFLLWLRNHFAPRKPEGTGVLILDGHSSHCSSVDTLEFVVETNIVLLCLPSHTTNYLQPHDRALFKTLKSYYYDPCNCYIRMNPNRKISTLVFGRLLTKAWVQAATTENAISGFRSTGIALFNPDAIPEYSCLTSTFDQQQKYYERRENRSTLSQPGCSHWQEIPNPLEKAIAEVDNNRGLEYK